MAVGGDLAPSERTRVGHEPDLARRLEGIAEDVVAALRKRPADGKRGVRRIERGVCVVGARAQEPAGLVVERARLRLEIGAPEEDRAGREERAIAAEARAWIEAHGVSIVRV